MVSITNERIESSASSGTKSFERPQVRRDELVTAIALFLLSTAYLCIFRRYSSLEPDEGVVLQGAERILRGEVPYRDFFTFYTPGSFYLVALVLKIFGDTLAVARTSLTLAGAGCSLFAYLLARRVCSRSIALLGGALTTVAGVAYRFLVLHNWYSTLVCCMALYAALRLVESGRRSWSFGLGSLAATAVLFEQSKGAGLCLGLVVGFLALRTSAGSEVLPGSRINALLMGFAWPFLVTFAYFGVQHSISAMLQSWLWPLHHYMQANRVFFGSQNWSDHARAIIFHSGSLPVRAVKILAVSPGFVVPVFPLIAVGMLVYWILQTRRRGLDPTHRYYVLMCSVLSGLFLSVVITRADIIHFMYLSPLWFVVLSWILGSPDLRGSMLNAARPWLTTYVIAAFGLMGLAVLVTATGAHDRIATRKGAIVTGRRESIIEYVQAQVSPGQVLLVYPYLPLYNYLTDTRSPLRYDYFQPGMNTADQAQEIVRLMQSGNVRSVLFEPWFAEKFAASWPGTPLGAIARDPVADYLAKNYRICRLLDSAANWRFEYLVREGDSCR